MQAIKDKFDPQTIPDGVYATTADSRAYPLLVAMKVAGTAKLLGEAFQGDGTQVATFRIGKAAGRPVAANPRQMGIEQRWFQNATLDYESWKEKFWREVVQNSADAGAGSIDLYATKNPDGTWSCGCIDDGSGMTLDVLVDKFLVLGGTTKEGGIATSGGFGKAKELLLLPWIQWRIRSGDYVAVGAGNQFEVFEVKSGRWAWSPGEGAGAKPGFEPPPWQATHLHGTHLEVIMPEEKHTVISAAMCFVEKCYLPRVSFRMRTNDPEPIDMPFAADLRNGRTLEEIEDKVRIHYTKATTRKPRCIVRTREGLFMFEESLPYDVSGYVVVEMLKPSVELLTSNRDGFADWEVRQRLREFLTNLARNTKSALKAQKNKITEVYRGEKFSVRDIDTKTAELTAAIGRLMEAARSHGTEYEVPDKAQELVGDILEEEYRQASERAGFDDIVLKTTRASAEVLAGIALKGRDHAEAMARQLIWTPSFIIHNELSGFRVPKRFRPEGMRASELRLVKVWTELCKAVLIQLGCREEWGVGWVFSEDALAQYWRYEGVSWLMLNPFKSPDTIYVPTLDADRNLLFSMAVHECTHLADGAPDHEETFTTAFTKNLALCAPLMKRLKKLVAAIPLRGQEEFAESKRGGGLATPAPAEAPPLAGTPGIVQVDGKQAYLHVTVTGSADGVLVADEKGMAHVLWAHPSEALMLSAAMRYLREHGMHDEATGALWFETRPMNQEGRITIVDSTIRPIRDVLNHPDLVEKLRSQKNVARWLAGLFRVLGGDAWRRWTWHVETADASGAVPFFRGSGEELADVVEEALHG